MECPKCHFDHPLQPADTCLRCGIVFSRYAATAAAAPSGAGAAPAVALERPEPPLSADELAEIQKKARHELTCRVFALPGALLLGWLTASAMPMLAGFLRMWTHESGHAITAWLCGYVAIPTAWFTIIFPGRQRGLSLLLAAGLAFGGYVAWQRKRWFWVATTAAALVATQNQRLRCQATYPPKASPAASSRLRPRWRPGKMMVNHAVGIAT